ncbi:MAG: cysteine desulfurase-like protein [Planctomycetes bacterium]|nr:cysteine desulfurase-like protein [Planctomycetota bacterium]
MVKKNHNSIDRDRIRRRFPALESDMVFFENAGGSQVPKVVADRMHDYLLNTYVQLDAGYALSDQSTRTVEEAHTFINLLMNGSETGKVVFGASTSVLLKMLADCYGDLLNPGDEIIVAESGHEANVGPWMKLADRGLTIRIWKFDPKTMLCPLEDLGSMLNERTKIVALPHTSNLLGDIVDIKAINSLAHHHGAKTVVDGVAYAPHRIMDVKEWEVDWYAYSTYKVYGPHMAVLYGKHEAFEELTGPNHYFVPREEVPYKFELGGACHEACAGLLGLADYLSFLAARENNGPMDRDTLLDAYEVMVRSEIPLQNRLISYLLEKPEVRIIGPKTSDQSRVATVSFVHNNRSSREIARAAHEMNFGIRNGHMYAHRLCKALDLDPDDGVVRISMVHYNTPEEVDRLIEFLEETL